MQNIQGKLTNSIAFHRSINAIDDRLKAAETLADENSDKSLQAKLAEAGIGEQKSNANAVLDRIKARKS